MKKIILIIFIILLLLAGGTALFAWNYYNKGIGPVSEESEEVFVVIESGQSAYSILNTLDEAGLVNDGVYFEGLHPLEDKPIPMPIGTDVAEVSYKVPTITLSAATMCKGTLLHHWATTKQSGMSIGHKGMFYAARCMAEGTLDFLAAPENIGKAWELHRK